MTIWTHTIVFRINTLQKLSQFIDDQQPFMYLVKWPDWSCGPFFQPREGILLHPSTLTEDSDKLDQENGWMKREGVGDGGKIPITTEIWL